MKKHLLALAALVLCTASFAQTATLQQRLYYTCKVWGFVKYYHSRVSTCGVDWDSVLVSVLPSVRTAATDSAFNDALDSMLAAAGPMTLASSPFPDVLPPELKRNRDWTWFDASPILRGDVRIQMDTIRNNFRPHAECWVMDNDYTGSYFGWLVFPHDSVELNVNTSTAFPDEDHRLLMLFKYWNVIRYFNPYNYVLDIPWDTTLYQYAPKIDTVSSARALYYLYLRINTALNDVHTYGFTYSSAYQEPPGVFQPPLRLLHIPAGYVIVKSSIAGINAGDMLVSVDGLTTTQWEDSLKEYYSSGNTSVMRRSMYQEMLAREVYNSSETLVVADSTGTNHTFTTHCTVNLYNNYHSFYYPNDSLNTIRWTTMNCDIGYVNMGNLQIASVDSMYSDLRSKKAIIFDIRNYPNSTAWPIANLMYPNHTEFSKLTEPDVTYPGTYFWYHDYLGTNGNPTPYNGQVIILMDEETQSQAEFTCMILEAMPNVVKIGSQTAGADGNVSFWKLSNDLYTGFTTLGVYYPNGDSTQRIGIVPDTVVYPTSAGIRHKDDEALNAALSIACSASYVHNPMQIAPTVSVYPNPANSHIAVRVSGIDADEAAVSIADVTGRSIITRTFRTSTNELSATLDISSLSSGLYFVSVNTGTYNIVRKFVKD